LVDGGKVEAATTAEDADPVVVVEGANTEVLASITVEDIKKHKFMC
jgi:hypothetical protein